MYLVPPKHAERQDMHARSCSKPPQPTKLHTKQKVTERSILKVTYMEINRIPPVAMVGRYWRDKTAILGAERHFATERTDIFVLEELTTDHPIYGTACDNHTKVIKSLKAFCERRYKVETHCFYLCKNNKTNTWCWRVVFCQSACYCSMDFDNWWWGCIQHKLLSATLILIPIDQILYNS